MLACERHGSGEPLVLVHGVTHRRQAWYPVLDQLAEHREVILVDLPGHGQSPRWSPTAVRSPDVLREQFKQFLDRPGARPPARRRQLPRRPGRARRRRRTATPAASPRCRRPGSGATSRRSPTPAGSSTRACSVVDRLGDRAERLARSRAGRQVDLRRAHGAPRPGAVRPRARRRPRVPHARCPALRTLLDAAEPFTGEIAPDVPVTIAWAAPRPGAAAAGRRRWPRRLPARRAHHDARRRARADERRRQQVVRHAAARQRAGRPASPLDRSAPAAVARRREPAATADRLDGEPGLSGCYRKPYRAWRRRC